MAAHRYWRLLIHTVGSGDTNCSISELIGYNNISGSVNVLKGGTASASSTYSIYAASQAFDNNVNTFWNTNTFSNGTWLKYDLGASNPQDIQQIVFKTRNDNFYTQAPLNADWQFSDDDVTYTTLFTFTAPTMTAAGGQFIYPQAATGIINDTFVNILAAAANPPTTTQKNTSSFVLTALNMPTMKVNNTVSPTLVARLPSGLIKTTQTDILVAIIRSAAERVIRAWTFTQDDHDFYVLLAAGETYVYDKHTQEWAQWYSADTIGYYTPNGYWRGIDGVEWDGINVCIDGDSGKLFKIDPINRLDYGTTPITSQIIGGLTERMRTTLPIYMAEVAISQAKPPSGIDPTTVGITLETFDTVNWYSAGQVTGAQAGTFDFMRYYGLGQIGAPGMLFRITDTGYARRIDGLNIEVGNKGGNV